MVGLFAFAVLPGLMVRFGKIHISSSGHFLESYPPPPLSVFFLEFLVQSSKCLDCYSASRAFPAVSAGEREETGNHFPISSPSCTLPSSWEPLCDVYKLKVELFVKHRSCAIGKMNLDLVINADTNSPSHQMLLLLLLSHFSRVRLCVTP